MQENDMQSINKLVDIVAEIKGLEITPSKFIKVSLIPPVVLILQLIEMTLSSIGNIAGVFTNLGVSMDPFFFLQQYVPHIDWAEFKKAVDRKKMEDATRDAITGGAAAAGPPAKGGTF